MTEGNPARPQAVHMDEEELEILSESRARLFNRKGKKAKLKAVEKQLHDSKRLVQLSTRRDPKAAGARLKKPRNNRKVTDYTVEIPFMRSRSHGVLPLCRMMNRR